MAEADKQQMVEEMLHVVQVDVGGTCRHAGANLAFWYPVPPSHSVVPFVLDSDDKSPSTIPHAVIVIVTIAMASGHQVDLPTLGNLPTLGR